MITSLLTTVQDIVDVSANITNLVDVSANITNLVDVSANITNLVDVSANITNITQTNWKQINDASLNLYTIYNKIYDDMNYLVYSNNFRGLNDNYESYFEDEESAGVPTIEYNDGGLKLEFNSGGSYRKTTRFFPPVGGKTLYMISLVGPQTDSSQNLTFDFGVESYDEDFLVYMSILFSQTTTPTISLVLNLSTDAGNLDTINVAQTAFNVDKIDGTGISGFNYTDNWQSQTLFILTDDNLHYIFGLHDGKQLIPIHSFHQVDEIADNGGRTSSRKPFFRFIDTTPGSGDNPLVTVSGLRIFKSNLPILKIINSTSGSDTATAGTEEYLFSIRYADLTQYRGNINLNNISIYSDRICKINIYYGNNSNSISLTGASFSDINNAEVDTSADNTFSGGDKIYEHIIDTNANVIDLKNIIDFKYFGYNQNYTIQNLIMCTCDNLEAATTANLNFCLTWYEF